jgi:hypothetical protein
MVIAHPSLMRPLQSINFSTTWWIAVFSGNYIRIHPPRRFRTKREQIRAFCESNTRIEVDLVRLLQASCYPSTVFRTSPYHPKSQLPLLLLQHPLRRVTYIRVSLVSILELLYLSFLCRLASRNGTPKEVQQQSRDEKRAITTNRAHAVLSHIPRAPATMSKLQRRLLSSARYS